MAFRTIHSLYWEWAGHSQGLQELISSL